MWSAAGTPGSTTLSGAILPTVTEKHLASKKKLKKLAYIISKTYFCRIVYTNLSTCMSKNRLFILIDATNIGDAEAYTTRSEVAKRIGCNRKTITKKSPVFYDKWVIVETRLNTAMMGWAAKR